MSNFQIILLGVFGFFIMVGVFLFATFSGSNKTEVGSVVVWGTVDQGIMNSLLNELHSEDSSFNAVTYKEIDANNFDTTLAEAMAGGQGPDVFIIPQDSIIKHQNKMLTIPYDRIPERDFIDKFIQEGELFLTNDGVLGVPLVVDPLVMYWNRDIFSRGAVSLAPKKWDDFFALSEKLTQKDNALNIIKATVPFGEFVNVKNAKEIISTLVLQSGSSITKRQDDGVLESTLSDKIPGSSVMPAEQALSFYTQFSNPSKTVYSWNRSLPESDDMFIAGDLALYFGFASELSSLRQRNPNLNFDVALMPQTQDGHNETFGRILGMSIARNSTNPLGALAFISAVTGDTMLAKVSELFNLPPVSRTLLSQPVSGDPYLDVFYKSAILSRGWLDPDPAQTNQVFRSMVEAVVSGREKTNGAVNDASSEIDNLIKK